MRAVDKHHLVALAPPIALVLQQAKRHADILAWALRLQDRVVAFTEEVLSVVYLGYTVRLPVIRCALVGLRLSILGVEVHHVGG